MNHSSLVIFVMRISGGTISRLEIRVPAGIRPTQDKVRAALFNSLGEAVVGARVLDLFAGSGALGIEAWSRGASFVCWVEDNRRVAVTLKENVHHLCGGGAPIEIRQIEAMFFLKKGWTGRPFDLILADPPYDRKGNAGRLGQLLLALKEGDMLVPGGLLVFEQGASENVPEQSGWSLLRDRKYGDTRLLIFRRAARPEEEKL
jgi:16S rRNA (guanine966-N2)-methyltransferase